MKRRTFVRSALGAALASTFPVEHAFGVVRRGAWQVPPDVAAVRGDGTAVTLRGRDIAELSGALRGRLLMADDAGYEEARQVLNPSFDKRPALIAQVTGSADVRTAVDFARAHDLLLAVKCGGHSASGKSTCDGGMMIDLSPFQAVRVDPEEKRAWVAGGTLLGLLDHEAMAYGLVTTMGTVSHTGVGGLTTGGGFGRVARRFGLALDNVTAIDIVTADGRLRQASATENADLFWGVRGGGGNFGIVTSFEFRLHEMQRDVVAGTILYPIGSALDVLTIYGDYGPQAPDDLYFDAFLAHTPEGGEAVCGFSVCYSGPASRADQVLRPLRQAGTPLNDDVVSRDYVAVQRSGDIDDPRALGQYLKGGFIPNLPGALARAIVDGFEGAPGRVTQLFFQHGGGAVSRVGPTETAFPNRAAFANMMTASGWTMGSDPAEHIAYIRSYWAELEPYARGFYTNDIDPDMSAAAVDENYRENHPRLVQIKNRYDPTNLFRLNANVEPTV